MSSLFSTDFRESASHIQYWRDRILDVILIAATILGGVTYAVNFTQVFTSGDTVLAVFYSVALGWIFIITIFRRIPYVIRAVSIITLLFFIGLGSAIQFASVGDVRIWWLGCSILTAVLFGTWPGISMTAFSTAIYLFVGWLQNNHFIATPDLSSYLSLGSMYPWISTSIPFVAICLLTILSFSVIINGMKENLEKATDLTAELEADRIRLLQRTTILERREIQIRTAAEISRTISAELDPDKIFQQVVDLIKERFGLYYVGVFMLDDSQQFAILRVGSGEEGQKMMQEGHILAVGGASMIGWAISNQKARIALDVGEDAVHFQNPHLPLTRSELALPMISEKKVLGALTVQSVLPEAFDQDDITVLQGVTDSLATAIANADLFNQVQDSLDEINILHRQYLIKAWEDVARQEKDLSFAFEPSTPEITSTDKADPEILEVPLVLRDQIIGTIQVERNQEPWSTEDQNFLNGIASQAALALENARLVQQTERGAQYNRSVTDITSKIWSSASIDTILRTALQELGQTLGASDGLIQLHMPQDQEDG